MTDSGSASPTCIRCGEPVASDALRCPHCALTFPALQDIGARQGDDVAGPAAPPPAPPSSDTPPPSAETPLSTGTAQPVAPPPPVERHDTAPQPIFPPSAAVEQSSNRWRWAAAAAVVLLAVVAVVVMSQGGGDGPVADGPPAEPELGAPSFELVEGEAVLSLEVTNLEAGDAVRLLIDGEQVDEQTGPSPVSLSWIGAAEGDHRIVVQVRRNEQQVETASDVVVPPPVPGIDSFDGWIMALASLDTREQADRYLAELDGIDDGRILLSDDWPSLRPGFWVVYAGPFATGDQVLSRCRELDRDIPNDCVGRVLTRNSDDRTIIAN